MSEGFSTSVRLPWALRLMRPSRSRTRTAAFALYDVPFLSTNIGNPRSSHWLSIRPSPSLSIQFSKSAGVGGAGGLPLNDERSTDGVNGAVALGRICARKGFSESNPSHDSFLFVPAMPENSRPLMMKSGSDDEGGRFNFAAVIAAVISWEVIFSPLAVRPPGIKRVYPFALSSARIIRTLMFDSSGSVNVRTHPASSDTSVVTAGAMASTSSVITVDPDALMTFPVRDDVPYLSPSRSSPAGRSGIVEELPLAILRKASLTRRSPEAARAVFENSPEFANAFAVALARDATTR